MNSPANLAAIKMQEVTVSSRRDGARPVLAGVNWTVAPGEFWVVSGLQRSGKTDFLMLTAGLLNPLAGSYELFGRETVEFGEAELAERLQVAYVFEEGQLFHQLTIAENIALPLRYHRNLDAGEAVTETLGLLELLELTPLAGAAPGSVSRDWLKRAALARSLVLGPKMLLCDNPLHGLGHRHRQWWLKFLDQLWHGHDQLGGQPMTVVVTTDELGPWKLPARQFALLRDQQFFQLGSWVQAAGSGDPVFHELLTAPPEHNI